MTDENTIEDIISPEALAAMGTPYLVYVRPVIGSEIKADANVEGTEQLADDEMLYALHAADGTRVAVVDTREEAFIAARQHDMEPVSVH